MHIFIASFKNSHLRQKIINLLKFVHFEAFLHEIAFFINFLIFIMKSLLLFFTFVKKIVKNNSINSELTIKNLPLSTQTPVIEEVGELYNNNKKKKKKGKLIHKHLKKCLKKIAGYTIVLKYNGVLNGKFPVMDVTTMSNHKCRC